MPYLGNAPAEAYSQISYQDLTGGSGTSFTLDYPAGSAGEIEVFVNNVRQEPTVAYTVSGTSLTMTGSIAATDDFYVVFQSKAQQTIGIPEKQSDGTYVFDDSVTIDADGSTVLTVDRATSDGTIVDLQKDGSTVGSIGTDSGNFNVDGGANKAGVQFTGSSILPRDNSANADATITLGGSSNRFNNLYLSGGVYLGGTAAANQLDDYEFGFFEPTYGGKTTDPSGVTYDSTVGNEGYYVKVGRLVFVQINIRTDAISSVGSGDLLVRGLPFATATVAGQGGIGSLTVSQSKDFLGEVPIQAYIEEGVTYVTMFYKTAVDGDSISSACSDLATGSNSNLLRIGGTYYTTS